ncbi:MAG: adenine deaminase [Bacteriovoracaceae bacterium]|nr:adenine deaminase [Bacteriovoracaceae bacterium]
MSLAQKRTQSLTREELKQVLAIARGESHPDVLIKNVKILDLINGGVFDSAIVLSGKTIAGIGLEYSAPDTLTAKLVIDAKGAVAVPGFIDGHLHIESSMMNPFEFERMTLPLGTTTAICDPHEITNVMGDRGYAWFLRCSELMHQNLFVQTSSCVPALPGFETNGGEFKLSEMLQYKKHPNVLGLAEMMNFPGVINANEDVLDKLEAYSDLNLDGHSPLLRGKALNAYIASGIQNCHETVTQDEGREKLQKGMALIIREGSVAKNIKTFAPLVSEFNSTQCLLCTDDRNPYEILEEGHINYMIKKMINEMKVPPHIAYRLSSYSAAKHFGLKKLGLIAPGKQADFVLLSDMNQVLIQDVYIAGKNIKELGLDQNLNEKLNKSNPPLENTIKRKPLMESDFDYQLKIGKYNVIEIVKDEIITNHLVTFYDGEKFSHDDVCFMANIERYGSQLKPALGLVRGSGIQSGAIAASVAHDSHNLMVIGKTITDMVVAVNALIKSGGGLCVSQNNQVSGMLELPLAGLLSLKTGMEIFEDIKKLKTAYKNCGITLEEPFIQMAFLALPVIPKLKLTDRGLFDVTTFSYIDLEAK